MAPLMICLWWDKTTCPILLGLHRARPGGYGWDTPWGSFPWGIAAQKTASSPGKEREDNRYPAGPDAPAPRPALPRRVGPGAAPAFRRDAGAGRDRRRGDRLRLRRHDGRVRAV